MSLKTLGFLLEFREKLRQAFPWSIQNHEEVLWNAPCSVVWEEPREKTVHFLSALELSLRSDFLQCFPRGIYAITGMFVLF